MMSVILRVRLLTEGDVNLEFVNDFAKLKFVDKRNCKEK